MNNKKSFGRELNTVFDALTPVSSCLSNPRQDNEQQLSNYKLVSIAKIKPNSKQPRKDFCKEELEQLALSIAKQGVLQPILVRESILNKTNNCIINSNNDIEDPVDIDYEIIAGERRWLAAKLAGVKHIPVIIFHIDDKLSLAYSLVENLQRQDLNPIEKADGFMELKKKFNLTHEQIAEQVGYSRTLVSNFFRLLNLPDNIKTLLKSGQLDLGHARALLNLNGNEQQDLVEIIINNKLSVRDVEGIVKSLKEKKYNKTDEKTKCSQEANINSEHSLWVQELSEKLATKVAINLNNNGCGRLTIDIKSKQQLDWLIQHINIIS